jgi:hypothetical protein
MGLTEFPADWVGAGFKPQTAALLSGTLSHKSSYQNFEQEDDRTLDEDDSVEMVSGAVHSYRIFNISQLLFRIQVVYISVPPSSGTNNYLILNFTTAQRNNTCDTS